MYNVLQTVFILRLNQVLSFNVKRLAAFDVTIVLLPIYPWETQITEKIEKTTEMQSDLVSAKKQVNSQAIFHGIHAPLFLLIATCHTSKHVVGG